MNRPDTNTNTTPGAGPTNPLLASLIVPIYNEAETIASVLTEAIKALDALHQPCEVLAVDDGSTDGTATVLAGLQAVHPCLRVLRLEPNSGQSAAFDAGFRACRGAIAVLMDGDGQNDPHDIPNLVAQLEHADACCGIRAVRRDTLAKRWGSRLANRLRQRVLGDGIIDTGCSLKAIRTEFLKDLPMSMRGMHRFLPALLLLRGARLAQIPVNHRPRAGGKSKYTNWGRLKETVWDLWALRWMQRRHRNYQVKEVGIST